MENASYIALSKQMGLQRELSALANNVANANTTGFKGQRVLFEEYLEQPRIGEKLSYVLDRAMAFDFSEGPLQSTGNTFDLSITGQGFFVVDTPGGPRYTRTGTFKPDQDGNLVTTEGYPVLDENNNPLSVPLDQGALTIDSLGFIRTRDGAEIARMQIVEFEFPQAMQRAGSNLFISMGEPLEAQTAKVVQGALEGSNVNTLSEMSRMIEVHRSYERASNVIQQEHDRMRDGIRRLGKPVNA
ncbi:MAG: flagellar basal-body rod protein FlgF [Alphaproteobacteria bacterium]|nr:flagellar basal-body rod protein FlgF [Alphaproteobacteria bacterium]MBU0797023.1 flagellar basal-body rod protein FlgF [Alphaproteobacteria bacterium]MBU0886571.1 flagellar basal-body rod protein FlgF [Alphaproteobacteria bacterium]MBU1814159.1 flagellar basal-body rod protein FlgF [Alphaproteobacteria bacterium]